LVVLVGCARGAPPRTLRAPTLRVGSALARTLFMQNLNDSLQRRFGPLMTSAETAKVLKFRTVNAMRMAIRRRQLLLRPITLAGRRGHFFSTAAIASTLESLATPRD